MKRITFKIGKTIQVVRLGTTTNEKISKGKEQIVQTYTYSDAQFALIVLLVQIQVMQNVILINSDNILDLFLCYVQLQRNLVV